MSSLPHVVAAIALFVGFTHIATPMSVRSEANPKNMLAAIKYYGALKFLKYVNMVGLNTTLKDLNQNFTVFAPSNVAFDRLPKNTLKKLENNLEQLKQVVTFHITQGYVPLTLDDALYPSLSSYDIRVDLYSNPDVTTVSGSTILLLDNPAKNGVLHVMNKVLYPVPTGTALSLINTDNFNMLLLALTKAGLGSLFSVPNVTVLAPSDVAFQMLPAGLFSRLLEDVSLLTKVLQNHVVRGVWYSAYFLAARGGNMHSLDGQQLNVTIASDNATLHIAQADVTQADVSVTNGVVHVISHVLLPPDVKRELKL